MIPGNRERDGTGKRMVPLVLADPPVKRGLSGPAVYPHNFGQRSFNPYL